MIYLSFLKANVPLLQLWWKIWIHSVAMECLSLMLDVCVSSVCRQKGWIVHIIITPIHKQFFCLYFISGELNLWLKLWKMNSISCKSTSLLPFSLALFKHTQIQAKTFAKTKSLIAYKLCMNEFIIKQRRRDIVIELWNENGNEVANVLKYWYGVGDVWCWSSLFCYKHELSSFF